MAAWRQKHRDQAMLEERRKEAIRTLLHQHDDDGNPLKQSDVAKMFRVTPSAVSRWVDSYKRAGNSVPDIKKVTRPFTVPSMIHQQLGVSDVAHARDCR